MRKRQQIGKWYKKGELDGLFVCSVVHVSTPLSTIKCIKYNLEYHAADLVNQNYIPKLLSLSFSHILPGLLLNMACILTKISLYFLLSLFNCKETKRETCFILCCYCNGKSTKMKTQLAYIMSDHVNFFVSVLFFFTGHFGIFFSNLFSLLVVLLNYLIMLWISSIKTMKLVTWLIHVRWCVCFMCYRVLRYVHGVYKNFDKSFDCLFMFIHTKILLQLTVP